MNPEARYEITLREQRTFEPIVSIRPRDALLTWTRRDLGNGSFKLTLPIDSRYNPETVRQHLLLTIDRHDGQQWRDEFTGVIEERGTDPLAKRWELAGPELANYWLPLRVVGVSEAEPETGPAETVIKRYMNRHAGPLAAIERRFSTEVSPLVWRIEPDAGRGAEVSIPGQRASLWGIAEEACRAGTLAEGLLQEVVILPDESGYEYRVRSTYDRTEANGFVPFGVDFNTVEALKFLENTRSEANVLYVAGAGQGDTRDVSEVRDDSRIALHMRREAVIDARDAATEADRITVGQYELAMRARKLVSVSAKPHRTSGSARYRLDWDVGDYVTFAEPRLYAGSLDVLIVAATVTLAGRREDISFELGEYKADSALLQITEAFRRLQRGARS